MPAVRRSLPLIGICLGLFVVAFIYLVPGINQPVNIYDEGIITYSAVRVMQGQVPYRDFWSIYSPGQFYVLAAAFKAFGTTIMVERVWDTATRALLAVFAYLIVARLTSRRVALVAWAAVTVWVGYYSYSYQYQWVFYGYPAFPAIACCLASILFMTQFFAHPQQRWLVASGLALGIAALFRHDFAIYSGVGQAVALALYLPLIAPAGERPAVSETIKRFAQRLLPFVVSAVVIVLPVAVYFVLQVKLGELVYDLFTFPTSIFPRFRTLPYPPLVLLDNVAFYLPFVVFLLAGAVAVVMARRRTAESVAYALCVMMVIVFGLFAFNQARVRADLIHTPAFFIPAVILIVVLLRGLPHAQGGAPEAASTLPALAFLMLVLIVPQPLADRIDLLTNPKRLTPSITHGLERASTAVVGQSMVEAVKYIQSVTQPGDRIYVGNTTHDRVFVNEPMFYFLAARDSATRYHELHPGVATTAPVQTEMAADLEKYQVKYLVLSNAFEGVREPNESALSSGVKILDRYIADHYLPVMQFGQYAIWRRV